MSFSVRTLRDEPKSSRSKRWIRSIGIAVKILAPIVGLYEVWSARKAESAHREHREIFLKKILTVLVAVFCAFLVIGLTLKGLMALRVFTLGDIVSVSGTPPPTDAHGHTNILLLGQGDADHDGIDLTDSIMVASIDASHTNSVSIVSLPRDLYLLKTEKMGKGRVNSLYRDYKSYLRGRGMSATDAAQEAMKELAAELGRNMGVEIHHTVKVDFAGFVKTVDELDGIEIDVPEAIVDTEYPDGEWGYETFSIDAGLQKMDGETALKYVRSRHSSSDFDRSARQQQVLKALADKAEQSGVLRDPVKITGLYRILSEHLNTTMGTRELIGLAEVARTIDRSRLIAMQLNDRNGLYGSVTVAGGFLYTPPRSMFDGASVLLPVSIPEFPVTWKQIETLIELLFRQRSAYLARPNISLLNAGAPSGSARKLADELTRYGFSITNVANASTGDREKTLLFPLSEEQKPIAEFFSLLLAIAPGTADPALIPEEVGPITIVLGEDYSYRPIQDLLSNLR